MQSVKSLKEKNKVISSHVGRTPNITPSRPMPPEKHSTPMKCLFSKPQNLVLVKHVF